MGASSATTNPPTKAAPRPTTSQPPLNSMGLFYMVLLALQFGIQPILTRRYAPTGIIRSTVILMQEAVKFVLASFMLYQTGALKGAIKEWTFASFIAIAMLPAALYSVQNMAALMAYQNLDSLTFNVLNQTKTLSAALCCYLVMGQRQSGIQVLALGLLLLSALVMEGIVPVEKIFNFMSGNVTELSASEKLKAAEGWDMHHLTYGVLPIMIASFISGLAGALTQKNLQATSNARNTYMFSMELCIATGILLTSSLVFSPDGAAIVEDGFWKKWTSQTWIPIFTNACGGVLVGMVTKYAGSVRKGFALIFGMCLSGILQALAEPDVGVSPGQIAGGLLAAISLYLHSTFPPSPRKTLKQD